MADLKLVKKSRLPTRLNVIFIHGLNGDPVSTWQSSETIPQFWPSWLYADFDDIAIWTIGYEAPKTRWFPSKTAMAIQDRATNILELLMAKEQPMEAEIVLVGHSMGGLIIKQMLRTADSLSSIRSDAAKFCDLVRHVVFIATPHAGSGQASLMNTLRVLTRPSAATEGLVRNSPALRDLNLWYREWVANKSITHLILVETKSTGYIGTIVKEDSSDPGLQTRPIPIDADHSSISKPATKQSDVYIHIRKLLSQ
ncbi:alpha/beta fold hydrolase [Duganella sp. FT92W]|uniref:Alpha/beta fold hydrolase n=1 Tax=Pseudoduganella rivuli TaxID=2666085 RepID=A0A7X2IUH1_9BURK|nr:alpha/beta fold hydrolase [Pseudoduganella rivuli]MRV75713.1 alpha/beta fold hydrolase [Pseudoduganella rivuli]